MTVPTVDWIYISGRGHSGSTMLDGMLGTADSIVGVGELVAGITRYQSRCTCGQTLGMCTFWSDVRADFESKTGLRWDAAAGDLKSQAHVKRFLHTYLLRKDSTGATALANVNRAIARSICRIEGSAVCDSSKEITRALFLSRMLRETYIIHLVRHPQSILESHYWRLKKGSGFKFLRRRYRPKYLVWPYLLLSSVGWLFGNALAEVVRRVRPDRFLVVKYEDLIEHPQKTISTIQEFLGRDLSGVKQRLSTDGEFRFSHNVAGNGMRDAGVFKFDPTRRSRPGLPRRYRWIAAVCCWPLLLRYGYLSRGGL